MERDTLTFYQNRVTRQWRWRYQSAGNARKLANGGESYRNPNDAVSAALRVCGLSEHVFPAWNDEVVVERASGPPLLIRFP